ncbi:MAG: T9SS type A sorting domain-containing protein, partial [Bacteroidota bacterium]
AEGAVTLSGLAGGLIELLVELDGYDSQSENVQLTSDLTVLVTLNAITRVNQVYSDLMIELYPNPAKQTINLGLPSNEDTEIRIYAISGQLMQSARLSTVLSPIDISHLAPGTYLFEAVQEGARSRALFIKE